MLISLDQLNQSSENTLMRTLGIEFTYFDGLVLKAKMPVSSKVHQPFGLLHGGATAALMESLGSTLSFFGQENDTPKKIVGTDLQLRHLRSETKGWVEGVAEFIKKGRSLHVLDLTVYKQDGSILSKGSMTNMVLDN
jgi:uncharacterized protein (TIGR00369 family)